MNTTCDLDLITCRVGGTTIGIDLGRVQEVNRMVKATFVPGLPREVQGLINLRGNLLTVLDLGIILHGNPISSRDARNVIISTETERVGLLVDSVGNVVHTNKPAEDLPPHLPASETRWYSGLMQLDDDVMLVLKLDTALDLHLEETIGE